MLLWFSNPFISNIVMQAWEVAPVPIQTLPIHEVGIVLGGITTDKEPRDRVHVSSSSDRILHAVQLYREGRIKKILVSGGSGKVFKDQVPEAVLLKQLLLQCNIPLRLTEVGNWPLLKEKNTMIHTVDLQFLNVPQAIAAYIIETTEGPVLVEAGPYSTYDHLKTGVQSLGYTLRDIQHVLLTHIHFDHAGAAWALAEQGATIYVHPLGAPHLAHPEKLWNSAKRIYQDDMDRLWGEMRPVPESQLREIGHQEVLTMGDTSITAHHTPGHAVHHIAYQVGDAIFTGDVGGVRINRNLVEPPCPPPDINVEDWQQSIRLLRNLAPQALYLTHFGQVDDVALHLDRLDKQLINWADWVREKLETGQSAETITPDFVAYVKNQLRAQGASEELVKQYEAANPSWMSVAGLVRYWKKKEGS